MSEHFTLDELAELDAGLLTRRRGGEASRHLADCDECAARAEALRNTQQRLNDLGSLTMPADLAARLDRALRNAEATSAEDVVPDLSDIRERRLRRLPRWTYAAAAAVVVLGGAGIAVGTMQHGKSSPSVAAGTALKPALVPTSQAVREALVQQATGRTYTPTTLSDLAPALVVTPAGADALGTGGALPSGASGGGVGTTSTAHGPNQFSSTKSAPAPAVAVPPRAAESAIVPSLQRFANSRTALLRCAALITDTPNAAPLAVDFARWTNKAAHLHRVPSIVFVFAHNGDPSRYDVYVVAAACDDTSLLDFQVVKPA